MDELIKRNVIKLFFLITTILFSNVSLSSIPQKNERYLKKQINFYDKSIKKLKDKINKFEGDLGRGNKRYLIAVKERQKLFGEILVLKEKLVKREKALKRKYEHTKNILLKFAAQQLDGAENPASLLERDIFKGLLEKKIKEIKKEIRDNKRVMSHLLKIENEYKELKIVEREILGYLNELEEKKRRSAQKYVQILKKKDDSQQKYDRLRFSRYQNKNKIKKDLSSKKNVDKKYSELFLPPIRNISGIDYKENGKGLTFNFRDNQNIFGTRKGKIVYSKNLSTYGNLIMIDHGKNTRSIILGDFIPSVKKGMVVEKGQIIGKTSDIKNGIGKVYFDIRVKSKIQDTIELLDKDFISTKNSRLRPEKVKSSSRIKSNKLI
jgi:murein DD-endopeptidase MepM/ murein hydrolase activator NlpD